MTFYIKVQHPEDNQRTINKSDLVDIILSRYRRVFLDNPETQQHADELNIIVCLRLSLVKMFWELKGYLDLPYIDTVIRQTIQNFKNKHNQKTIKKESL